MKSYCTYANAQTPEGQERILTVVKLFRLFLTYEELSNLRLTLNFYRNLTEKKPKARFIVLSVDENNEFGFGIFDEKEIKDGKKLSKRNNYLHEYLPIEGFIQEVIKILEVRKFNAGLKSISLS